MGLWWDRTGELDLGTTLKHTHTKYPSELGSPYFVVGVTMRYESGNLVR